MAKPSWLQKAAKNTKDFFKDLYKDIKKNATKVWKTIRNNTGTNRKREMFKPGNLIAFNYDAKHKEKDFDKNPLVISLGPSKKHKDLYLGLNLHWVKNPKERVSLSSYFLELKKKRGGELVYDDIKPFLKMFKGQPVLRSYIFKRVSSKVYIMDNDQYLAAAAIPSEKIIKGISKNTRTKVGKET